MDPVSTIVTAFALGASAIVNSAPKAVKDAYKSLKELIRERYAGVSSDLDKLEERPNSEARRAVLEESLKHQGAQGDPELSRLAAQARALVELIRNQAPQAAAAIGVDLKGVEAGSLHLAGVTRLLPAPTSGTASGAAKRGSLKIEVSSSTPIVSSGSDFSIFVTIHNPFDAPVTIYQVLTHIPIELVDKVRPHIERLEALIASRGKSQSLIRFLINKVNSPLFTSSEGFGIAVAIGTEITGEQHKDLFQPLISLKGASANISNVVGVQLSFPEAPSAEQLDRIIFRLDAYKKGLIPVTIQPGDTVVRQFVLRTRHWLFFSPLDHTFNIQISYSIDGDDHFDTVPYRINIRTSIASVSIGAIIGAIMGSLLKNLSDTSVPHIDFVTVFQTLVVASIAAVAVVIAFARKAASQPIISIEDFWGGLLIGFSVGYFGFEQFTNLFTTPPSRQS